MKHPLIRTTMARWLKPDGLPSHHLTTQPNEVAPARHLEADALADHAIELIRGPDGGYLVAQAGPVLGAIFGRKLPATPFGWLFREADREEVNHVLRATEEDGLACILSADISLIQDEPLSFEAVLMAGGRGRAASVALSGTLAPFAMPQEREIRSPFLHLRSSRFVARSEAAVAAIVPAGPRWMARDAH